VQHEHSPGSRATQTAWGLQRKSYTASELGRLQLKVEQKQCSSHNPSQQQQTDPGDRKRTITADRFESFSSKAHKKQLNGREAVSRSQEEQTVQELGLCGTHWNTVLAQGG